MFLEKIMADLGFEQSTCCVASRVNVVKDYPSNKVYADFGLGMVPVFEFSGDTYLVPAARLEGMTKMEMLAWRDQNLV